MTKHNLFPYEQVQFNSEKGRHMIARQNIKGGQVVSIDLEPLAFIVFDPTEGKELDVFCVQCGKSTICPLPCPTCPDVFFCSTFCVQNALKSHHKYECPMRFYAILKCIAGSTKDSISVGKMIPLRIATMYHDDIIDIIGDFPNSIVHMNVENRSTSEFKSAFCQLMCLFQRPNQPEDRDTTFFEALADLLLQTCAEF